MRSRRKASISERCWGLATQRRRWARSWRNANPCSKGVDAHDEEPTALPEPATLTSVCALRAATALQGSRDVWLGDWGAERELANESAEPCYKLSFRLKSPRAKGPNRMSTNEVTLSIDDRVAVVEMHRPPMNFFDRDLLAVIADAGEEAQSDGARAIVLCS